MKATAPKVRMVAIAELVRHPRYQMRQDAKGNVKLERGKVREYATVYKTGGDLPPVKVAVVDGAPHLIDGWHRVEALEHNGEHKVRAEVYENVSARDAAWMAAQANLEHGLPLKKADIRRAFGALITARRHLKERGRLHSYREIATMLGNKVPHTTIRNWMLEDFPKIAGQYGKDAPGYGKPDELPRLDPQRALEALSTRHLSDALAAAKGVRGKARRGRLVAQARSVVEALEAGGTWELPPEDGEDF